MQQPQSAAAGPAPADQMVGLFDALMASFDRHGFFGCPFLSAAVEAEPGSPAHAATIADTQRRQQWLTSLARKAGADAPEALAGHLRLLIDGALASGRLLQDRSVIDASKAAARATVAAARRASCPPRPTSEGICRNSSHVHSSHVLYLS
ncbi:hypothetical protein [Streptomyces sp. NPDC002619]|uniref:hypothetical protein n=1 Tax=Streptomyces sp. NPDC002619 TaxID=3364655 RepID=UPI0036AF0DB3